MMETEPMPELPPSVEAALGTLIMNLTIASHDTGRAYYIDIYPQAPERPDLYVSDIGIRDN